MVCGGGDVVKVVGMVDVSASVSARTSRRKSLVWLVLVVIE